MASKTYYHFGTQQSLSETMELLDAVMAYAEGVINDVGAQRQVRPQLCHLEEAIAQLRNQLECGAQDSDGAGNEHTP